MELSKLKKEYGKLKEKYKLPDFKEINMDFEIDKLDKEMDNVLKAIRKIMMEKIVNSMSFLEMLLNPVNAPRMYQPFIRTMIVDDKKAIDDIYSSLADLSLISLDLEIESSEKGEAELINLTFSKWGELKPKFGQILKSIKQPRDANVKKERSYFG